MEWRRRQRPQVPTTRKAESKLGKRITLEAESGRTVSRLGGFPSPSAPLARFADFLSPLPDGRHLGPKKVGPPAGVPAGE